MPRQTTRHFHAIHAAQTALAWTCKNSSTKTKPDQTKPNQTEATVSTGCFTLKEEEEAETFKKKKKFPSRLIVI